MSKLSVIIPVYNVEKYLQECLDSAVNQTLKDIEIICVNDGSTDGSSKILKEYATKDSRIVIVNRPNQGVSAARNTAIDIAKGEFVTFMDSDDFYPENDVLEHLYNRAAENNVLICGGEFSDFDDNKRPVTLNTRFDECLSGYTFKKEGIVDYKDYQFDFGFHRFIYNLDFLRKNRLKYPKYKAFEDPVFFVNAMIAAKKFYAAKKVVYAYRFNHKEVNWDAKRTADMLKGINDNLEASKKYNLKRLYSFTLQRLEGYQQYVKYHLKRFNPQVMVQFLKISIKIGGRMDKEKLIDYNLARHCTGCGACEAVCSAKALVLIKNNQGFMVPEIDEKTCTNCGLCEKICQIDNWKKTLNPKALKCYAAVNKNFEDRLKSIDGGAAYILAGKIISKGGCFCGAAWKEGECKHIIIDKIEDFKSMFGSKYVQSYISPAIYKEIKRLCEAGKLVCFVGTSCQVSGLKLFLGKDYKNLYIADIICHGVSPTDTFYSFLKDRGVADAAKNAINVNFRDKTDYPFNLEFRISLTLPEKTVYIGVNECKKYGVAYLRGLVLRESCTNCNFCKLQRSGDITLGTFHNHILGKLARRFQDGWAASQIFINNKKGIKCWNLIKGNLKTKKVKVDAHQPNLRHTSYAHPNREKFFEQIKSSTFDETVEKFLDSKNNVALLNFHWENTNYGAILTSYALNSYINSLGFNACNINYRANFAPEQKDISNFEEFRKKYIPLTYKCETLEDLEYLNQYFGSFVTGSDQVLRWNFVQNENGVYYLKFVNDENKKIAYAGSFGGPHWEGFKEATQAAGALLSRFSHLSVRESSGVEIFKNEFKMRSTHVLDPVFLLQKAQWEKIASDFTPEKPVHYVVHKHFFEKLDTKLDDYIDISCGLKIEDWIAAIKNAPFVITDSFHGVCFCLIFKKQFFCIVENNPVKERIISLFKMFNIPQSERLVMVGDFDTNKKISPIDYSNLDTLLEKHKETSGKFLKEALYGDNEALYDPYYFKYKNAPDKKALRRRLLYCKIMTEITFGRKRKRYKGQIRDIKLALSMCG